MDGGGQQGRHDEVIGNRGTPTPTNTGVERSRLKLAAAASAALRSTTAPEPQLACATELAALRRAYADFRARIPRYRITVGVLEPIEWSFYDGGRRAHGEPLVCLPDTASTADSFFGVMQLLVAHGYRVVAVELPEVLDTVEAFVEAFYAFVDALSSTGAGFARVHLCGTGLGGFLALKYAQAHAVRVASLALTEAYLDTRRVRTSMAHGVSSSLPPPSLVSWLPEFALRKALLELLPHGRVDKRVAAAEAFLREHAQAMTGRQVRSRLLLTTWPVTVGSVRLPEERITLVSGMPVAAIGAAAETPPSSQKATAGGRSRARDARHRDDDLDEADDPRRAIGFGTRRQSRTDLATVTVSPPPPPPEADDRSISVILRGRPSRETAIAECLLSFPRARRALLKCALGTYPQVSYYEQVGMYLLVHLRRHAAAVTTGRERPTVVAEAATLGKSAVLNGSDDNAASSPTTTTAGWDSARTAHPMTTEPIQPPGKRQPPRHRRRPLRTPQRTRSEPSRLTKPPPATLARKAAMTKPSIWTTAPRSDSMIAQRTSGHPTDASWPERSASLNANAHHDDLCGERGHSTKAATQPAGASLPGECIRCPCIGNSPRHHHHHHHLHDGGRAADPLHGRGAMRVLCSTCRACSQQQPPIPCPSHNRIYLMTVPLVTLAASAVVVLAVARWGKADRQPEAVDLQQVIRARVHAAREVRADRPAQTTANGTATNTVAVAPTAVLGAPASVAVDEARKVAAAYADHEPIAALADQVQSLSDEQLVQRFGDTSVLRFGTAGLRAPIGAGMDRMNTVTVVLATRGVLRHLRETFGEEQLRHYGVVI
eukprot:ctg_334.g180